MTRQPLNIGLKVGRRFTQIGWIQTRTDNPPNAPRESVRGADLCGVRRRAVGTALSIFASLTTPVALEVLIDYRRWSMEVDRSSAEVWASWFRCLGDPSRVLLLNRLALARRPMTVGELVDGVDIGQPTVSHHLKVLAETGFVLSERRGNTSLFWVNERCLDRFPSAAELIMGVLPRYEPRGADCLAPWQGEEAIVPFDSGRRQTRRGARA